MEICCYMASFSTSIYNQFFIRCKCNSQAEFINVPKYPYFFLNYEKIGTEKCMIYIFMLVVIFFGINLMMIFIDNFWERIKKNMV